MDMKKVLAIFLCVVLAAGLLTGCAETKPVTNDGETVSSAVGETASSATDETVSAADNGTLSFTDSAGRSVDLPAALTKVAPSGSVAQMILMTLAPEYLVGLSSELDAQQLAYLPDCVNGLPVFGQFYGGKGNLNMEALLAAEPQIIIDLGDFKESVAEDMDGVQAQTGVPTVFIEASPDKLAQAYRTLGTLLHKEDKAEQLAAYIENTLAEAERISAQIPETERKTVMFGTGADGLACNAAGSTQAAVIDLVGAINAVATDEVSPKFGGTIVSLEQVYAWNPDVILLADGGPYDSLADGEWSELSAVKNGTYYEIPSLPYSWMAMPPSVNRVIGIWWLGNLLYPTYFNYDLTQKVQEYYQLFWDYTLTTEEAAQLLTHATAD